MSKRTTSNLLLLLTAVIWGGAFIAQKTGGDVGAFTFSCLRSILGALFLVPVVLLTDRRQRRSDPSGKPLFDRRTAVLGGLVCGTALFCGTIFQQIGIAMIPVGEAGFITALYTIIVPILALLLGKKVRLRVWISVVAACFGFYLLCMHGGSFRFQFGDLIVLFASLSFAVQIISVDRIVDRVGGIRLSCIENIVTAAFSSVGMIFYEHPELAAIRANLPPILYAGILSSGVGYTLQLVAQKNATPTDTALILSLEAVFSALFGALLLHERMALIQYLGCALIFLAVVNAQLPSKPLPARANSARTD